MRGKISEVVNGRKLPMNLNVVKIAGKPVICNNQFVKTSSSINFSKYLSGQLKEDEMYTPGSIVITCSQIKKEQTVS